MRSSLLSLLAVAAVVALAAPMVAKAQDAAPDGAKVFTNNCAPCHGAKGMGDGPAAAVLDPKPRNFVSGTFEHGKDAASIVKTATTGVKGSAMPPFKDVLKPEEITAVAAYVESLEKDAKDLPATGAATP